MITPIYQTATYAQEQVGQTKGYDYSRTGNPTRTALETCLAALEGLGLNRPTYGLAFASGMAATDTLLRLVKPGQHVVASDDVYGGTFRLFDKVLKDYGLSFTFTDVSDPAQVAQAIKPETVLVWLETPTNPLLKIADIAEISRTVKANNPRVQVAVDNTFATSYLQQPLALGADFVVYSTTKYISGHSDVVGGAIVTTDAAAYERLKFLQNAIGAVPGPMDAWLTLRGLKTLAIRMERHSANAGQIAEFLSHHPAVAQVIYPGLSSHPQHAVAKRQMRCYGGMISIILPGGEDGCPPHGCRDQNLSTGGKSRRRRIINRGTSRHDARLCRRQSAGSTGRPGALIGWHRKCRRFNGRPEAGARRLSIHL